MKVVNSINCLVKMIRVHKNLHLEHKELDTVTIKQTSDVCVLSLHFFLLDAIDGQVSLEIVAGVNQALPFGRASPGLTLPPHIVGPPSPSSWRVSNTVCLLALVWLSTASGEVVGVAFIAAGSAAGGGLRNVPGPAGSSTQCTEYSITGKISR